MVEDCVIKKVYVYCVAPNLCYPNYEINEKLIYIFHPEWNGVDVIETTRNFKQTFIESVEKKLKDTDVVSIEVLTSYLEDGRLILKNDSEGYVIAQLSQQEI